MASENFKSNLIVGLVAGLAPRRSRQCCVRSWPMPPGRLPKRQSRAVFIFMRRGVNHLQSWAKQWMT